MKIKAILSLVLIQEKEDPVTGQMRPAGVLAFMTKDEQKYLPHNSKADLKNFFGKTKGQTVIVGRGTYEELRKANGGDRRFLVVTRNKDFKGEDHHDWRSITLVDDGWKNEVKGDEVWILGGADIYTHFLNAGVVDEVSMSVIDDSKIVYPKSEDRLKGIFLWLDRKAFKEMDWVYDFHPSGEFIQFVGKKEQGES